MKIDDALRAGLRVCFAFVRQRAHELAIVLAYVGLHLDLIGPIVQNGDAGEYDATIEAREWGPATTHVGYIAAGRLLRFLAPGNTDTLMNCFCLAMGTAGGLAVYSAARRYGVAASTAVLGALSLLCIPSYLRGMLLSEVDVPLAGAGMLAVALHLWARPVLAGWAIGWAMLISPLAALITPLVVLTIPTEGEQRQALLQHVRRIAVTAAVALAVYLPVVFIFRENYVYGPRGLLYAPRLSYDLQQHWGRAAAFFDSEVGAWWVPYVIGLCALAAKQIRNSGSLLPGLCVGVAGTIVLGERFIEVPALLPMLTVAAVALAVGVELAGKFVRYAPVLAFAAFLAWQYPAARELVAANVDRARTQRNQLDHMTKQAPSSVVVVWNDRRRVDIRRLAASLEHPPQIWTERHFSKRQCQLRDSASRPTIWFFSRRLPMSKCLEETYAVKSLAVGDAGRRFSALVPRRTDSKR